MTLPSADNEARITARITYRNLCKISEQYNVKTPNVKK